MIQIKPVNKLTPRLRREIGEFARTELEMVGDDLANLVFEKSEMCYATYFKGRLAFIFGVLPRSFLGIPNEVWFLGSTNLSAEHAREIQSYFDVLIFMYETLRAKVPHDNPAALRFAKFLGFRTVAFEGEYCICEV